MLILIRHGQSTANRDGLLVGRSDVDLTEQGVQQAQRLRPRLAGAEVVIASPLQRAVRTAREALPECEVILDEAFIEYDYGILEGRPLAEVGASTWRKLQRDHELPIEGGESMASVDRRVHERLTSLFEEHRELVGSPERHLVIVSHVSPIKSAVAWALGVHGSVAWRIRLDNATMTTIGSIGDRPVLHGYNVSP